MPKAYSYLRYSHPDQRKGDSERRQLALTAAWCKRRGISLDEQLRADGISAFRGKNLAKGALADFIAKVEAGLVERGSYLVIEKLDRFSRAETDIAYGMFAKLLRAGITIVTLQPEREWTGADLRGFGPVELIVHFLVGNEESAKKSERLGAAWEQKRKVAAEPGGVKLSRMIPAWLELSSDRRTFKKRGKAVGTVRRIFRMVLDGKSVKAITVWLNQVNVPTIGRSKVWHHSYVMKILHNPAVIGVYQPHVLNKIDFVAPGGEAAVPQSRRRPIGEAIKNYYPAIIEEAVFYEAHQQLSRRYSQRGPNGKDGKVVANLFTRRIFDARDGSSMTLVDKGRKSSGAALVSSGAQRGKGAAYISVPYAPLEAALITLIHELKAADVLERRAKGPTGESKLAGLYAKSASLALRIEKTKQKAESTDSEELLDLIVRLEREKRETDLAAKDLAIVINSPSECDTLADCKSLAALMKTAKGQELYDLRLRLRDKLRALIARIDVSPRAEGISRFATVEVTLVNGDTRAFELVVARKKWHLEWLIANAPLGNGKTKQPAAKHLVRELRAAAEGRRK